MPVPPALANAVHKPDRERQQHLSSLTGAGAGTDAAANDRINEHRSWLASSPTKSSPSRVGLGAVDSNISVLSTGSQASRSSSVRSSGYGQGNGSSGKNGPVRARANPNSNRTRTKSNMSGLSGLSQWSSGERERGRPPRPPAQLSSSSSSHRGGVGGGGGGSGLREGRANELGPSVVSTLIDALHPRLHSHKYQPVASQRRLPRTPTNASTRGRKSNPIIPQKTLPPRPPQRERVVNHISGTVSRKTTATSRSRDAAAAVNNRSKGNNLNSSMATLDRSVRSRSKRSPPSPAGTFGSAARRT